MGIKKQLDFTNSFQFCLYYKVKNLSKRPIFEDYTHLYKINAFKMGKDIFGVPAILKKLLYTVFGYLTYYGLNMRNRLKVEGSFIIAELPEENVLLVSNHQTYYRDVIAMLHAIFAAKNKKFSDLSNPSYLHHPKTNIYYVAAEETMKKSGILPKIFSLVGAIPIKRTWRELGKEIKREVNINDQENIINALKDGWVISFPQGTTKAFAPGRKGTAHLIKQAKPTVIPIVIDGFRRGFDKKGLKMKKRGIELSIKFKPALKIDYNAPVETIMQQIMLAIEQDEKFKFQPHQNQDK